MIGNETPEHLWVRCWVNMLRFGQKLQSHSHSHNSCCYLSAHFTVQCKDTSTVYLNPKAGFNHPAGTEEKNEPGRFTIFPSYIPHYTTRHLSFKPRITIAMDIHTDNRNLLVTKPFQNFVRL